MQLRSGRRLNPPPPPRPRGGPRRRLEAGGEGVGEEDRISNLPEDLLLDVLSRLGCAREAVRTSVLGRQWRGLWRHLPDLRFDFDYLEPFQFQLLEDLLSQVTRPEMDRLSISIEDSDVAPGQISSLLRAAERLVPKNLTFRLC